MGPKAGDFLVRLLINLSLHRSPQPAPFSTGSCSAAKPVASDKITSICFLKKFKQSLHAPDGTSNWIVLVFGGDRVIPRTAATEQHPCASRQSQLIPAREAAPANPETAPVVSAGKKCPVSSSVGTKPQLCTIPLGRAARRAVLWLWCRCRGHFIAGLKASSEMPVHASFASA